MKTWVIAFQLSRSGILILRPTYEHNQGNADARKYADDSR